jgi:hypothetical protein
VLPTPPSQNYGAVLIFRIKMIDFLFFLIILFIFSSFLLLSIFSPLLTLSTGAAEWRGWDLPWVSEVLAI